MASFGHLRASIYDRASRQQYYKDNYYGLSAFDKHTKLVNHYLSYGADAGQAEEAASTRTDKDVLQETYRFVRTEDDDKDDSWEARLARKYYSRLFKEYCIADLSRYKESKIGMRWRTQKEVVAGKGQFVCGAKGCSNKDGLCSYEVFFAYHEAGEDKQALVKLRVCPECAYKLNYKKEKQYMKAHKRKQGNEEGEEAGSPGQGQGSIKKARQDDAGAAGGDDGTGPGYGVKPPPAQVGDQQHQAQQAQQAQGVQASVMPADDSVWERKQTVEVPTLEDELDQYLEGMFM